MCLESKRSPVLAKIFFDRQSAGLLTCRFPGKKCRETHLFFVCSDKYASKKGKSGEIYVCALVVSPVPLRENLAIDATGSPYWSAGGDCVCDWQGGRDMR